MDCYECARTGHAATAVSVCRNCGAGLCIEHTYEAGEYRVAGTTFGCPHDLRRPSGSSSVRTATAG
ncbi:MAG: DUF2180 family protein [Gaiellaceae bacterium]